MQQVLERNGKRMEKSRMLGARFEAPCRQWGRMPDFITRDPDIRKGLATLGAIRTAYLDKLGVYQNALSSFDEGLKEALKALAKSKKT